MATKNGTIKLILVVLTCVGMLVAAVYTVAATSADVQHNAAAVKELQGGYKQVSDRLHAVDMKLQRVLTILEERNKTEKP